jgi:SAM-dependent methyltransferase
MPMISMDRFSDVLYDKIYSSRVDLPFYLEIARRYPGRILEAACGTGRILLPTARGGATIVGFDLSQPRLEICRRKLEGESQAVRQRATVSLGDMLDCDFGRDFALVTMPFRGFQDLTTVVEERRALLNLHRHLKDDGRLVLDVFNPSIPFLASESVLQEFTDSSISLPDDGIDVRLAYRVLQRDYFKQTQDVEEIIYIDGPRRRALRQARQFRTRYIFRYELEYLLNATGFEVEHIYGGFDFSPFGQTYPGEIIVVAKKSDPNIIHARVKD